MFDTVVIATDGSESAMRAVAVALDVAERFDADTHALYVVDEREVSGAPDDIQEDLHGALESLADDALGTVTDMAGDAVTTAVREGDPAAEISSYAESVDADVVALGTRGRHGDHAFLLGSVAETVVRQCERPVLTVRQLEGSEADVGTA